MRLLDDMAEETRGEYSERVAEADQLPADVARRLAFDEASVAVPVLEKSTRLTDEDLVEVAETRGKEHMLAVTRRESAAMPRS